MYRTLLHQLLRQTPSAGLESWKQFKEKKKWQGDTEKDWEWRLDELRQAFSITLSAASNSNKVIMLIDALDEAGNRPAQEVISDLHDINEKLLRSGKSVSICFSCRRFPVLRVREGYEVIVEEYNQDDIKLYVSLQLRDQLDFKDRLEEEENILCSLEFSILEKASNIFQWVRTAVPLVANQWNNGESLDEIKQALSAVPSDLEEIYRHIFTEVVKRSKLPRTLHLIQWILFAERPLSVTDLRFALASDNVYLVPGVGSCKHSKGFVNDDSRMQRLISSLTGGLAEVKRHSTKFSISNRATSVQFIHQSVNDFLIKDNLTCLQPDTPEDIIGQAHDRLTRSCINYLKMEQTQWKEMSRVELRDVPLAYYSVEFLFTHAQKAEEHGVVQKDLINQFEWPSHKVFESWVNLYRKFNDSPQCPGLESTLFHVASSSNLQSTIMELLKRGINVEEIDEQENTAMHYAARSGCESIVKILLGAHALPGPRNKHEESPLIKAARAGHEPIVRLFLRLGEDVNAPTGDSGNALQVAVAGDHGSVVRLLLTMKAIVNAQGGPYGNALQAAASRGSKEVMQLLLDAGADTNAQGGPYDNALQAAAYRGSKEVVQLLLNAGADVNAQGGPYGNALQAAARQGSEEVVQLLLDAGADVNRPGGQMALKLLSRVESP